MQATYATQQRDYVAEWGTLERSQQEMALEKDALYLNWAESIKARIQALYNPDAGRSMSVSAFQQLLPGYNTKSPILLNALRDQGRSIPLLTAASKLLDRLEQDERYQRPQQ